MIVRSITVRGWRCYLNPVSVGPFDERLNVIHGPNAIGKSTLFEALRRAFVDSHRLSGDAVEAIQPWGRKLGPEVAVEFAYKGTEYRITKRFLHTPFSRLERKERGQFVPFREGVSADEWLREMLLSTPPGKGPARPENWGLAQILWVPQRSQALEDLSDSLVNRFRCSLSLQLATPEATLLEERIKGLYDTIYTPKGKFKTGKDAAPIVKLQEELSKAGSRLQEWRTKLQKCEAASRKVEELRARRDQAEREAQELKAALDDARARAEQYKTVVAQREQVKREVEAAQARYEDLKRRGDQIKQTRKEIAELQERLERLNAEVIAVEQEVALCQKALAQARAALEDARKNRRAAEEARNLASEARMFIDNQRQISAWRKTIADIQAAQQALNELQLQRAALQAPDAQTLKRIREALNSKQDALRNIQLSVLTLEIVPERDTVVEVIEGQPSESKIVSKGTPVQVQGTPQIVVQMPGIARLRVWGPVQSVEKHKKALAQADLALLKLSGPFGTDDIEELERREQQAAALERKMSDHRTKITTLCGGQAEPDRFLQELSREIARLEDIQREILAHHPNWQGEPPDAASLSRAGQEAYQLFSKKEEQAQAAYEKAQEAVNVAQARRAKLLAEIEAAKNALSRSHLLLNSLTSDEKTDEERERQLTELSMEWHAARARMANLEQELSAFGPDPLRIAERLEKQLEDVREKARKARDEANIEEGQLRALAAEGPYSEVVRTEELVTELERQLWEEDLRCAAVRLLYETMEQCRKEALSALTGPVERAASRMLKRIAGDRIGELKMGERFHPKGISPIRELWVGLDSVSGGEWEQIHLVTRLALAEVLASEDRQLIVWDDVLVATDMGRMTRVLKLIEEAADRLQIVILTCHPERYKGLTGARFIDLDKLVRAA